MSLVADAERIIHAETLKIAEVILAEVQEECPKKSGRSAKSFHIEQRGDSYAVVSSRLAAYYADEGNGGPGRIIYPRRRKYLKITNGINRTLGYAKSVHGYDGDHYVERVADRHR